MKFSKELVIKCQEYFKEVYGLDLSEGKADEYLESLADFYLAFVKD
ncbi:MAG: hypothetical protein WC472_00200 [Candidatus Paceibacterota bacterium]